MVSSYEFFSGPWHDVEWLIAEAEKFYTENVTPKGLGDRFTIARDRIMDNRGWEPSRALIEEHFVDILRELNVFYLPKQVDPGPGIVFPQHDIYGHYTHGKLRPFYDLVLKAGPAKYAFLGKKEGVKGPIWFGNSERTLVNIGRTKSAVLVEGFFDALACRLVAPDAPILSTGTKSLNDNHIHYLEMLGVKRLYLMLDNELAKGEKEEGAGNQAMRVLTNVYSKITDIEFRSLSCPNDDASLCLKNYRSAALLRGSLLEIAAR